MAATPYYWRDPFKWTSSPGFGRSDLTPFLTPLFVIGLWMFGWVLLNTWPLGWNGWQYALEFLVLGTVAFGADSMARLARVGPVAHGAIVAALFAVAALVYDYAVTAAYAAFWTPHEVAVVLTSGFIIVVIAAWASASVAGLRGKEPARAD